MPQRKKKLECLIFNLAKLQIFLYVPFPKNTSTGLWLTEITKIESSVLSLFEDTILKINVHCLKLLDYMVQKPRAYRFWPDSCVVNALLS